MDTPLAQMLFITSRQFAHTSVVTANSLTTFQLLIMSISWWQTPCWLWRYHSEGKKLGPSMLTEDQCLPTLGHHGGPTPALGSSHSLRVRWPAKPTGGWDLLWASPFSKGLSSLLSPPEVGNTSHSSKAVTLESPQPFLILLLPPQPIFLPSI